MPELDRLDKKFISCCFLLSREDILVLDSDDDGAINNVIIGIDKECLGVKLYDDLHGLHVDMFYINGQGVLQGDIIELNLKDADYFSLLLRFCVSLANKYKDVDPVDVFNTFQKKLRGFLEKSNFYTITNFELEPFKGKSAVMVAAGKRGIFRLDFLSKVEFYRDFFGGSFANKNSVGPQYVYLMINTNTSLFKIGTSKNPGYRERTLHSQEPVIHLIAQWYCSKSVEKALHLKYRSKRTRGEWFSLNIRDLMDIEIFMKEIQKKEEVGKDI